MALECSPARISLIENGKQGTRPKAVREMAQLYGLDDPRLVGSLEDLARQANDKGWWAGFEDVLPAKFSTYVDLETDARELLAFSGLTIHGLLQTTEYAHAVNRASSPDAATARLDRLVELRMARQRLLTEETPLTAWFVLDEACLRRPAGDQQVMRAQLEKLLELTELPNVTIQTLPFVRGFHAAPDGPFTVLRFPDPVDADVVYVEGPAGNIYLEAVAEVRAMTAKFDRLRVIAQSEEESKQFIATLLEEIRQA